MVHYVYDAANRLTEVSSETTLGSVSTHLAYDGQGRLVSRQTLSLSDSVLLADQLPAPSTGLIHLGQGRWSELRLRRPLQPKAQGGLTTVSQRLNPYAVTAFGQPGVRQAAQNNGSFTLTPILLANTPDGVSGDFAQIALPSQIIGIKTVLAKPCVLLRCRMCWERKA